MNQVFVWRASFIISVRVNYFFLSEEGKSFQKFAKILQYTFKYYENAQPSFFADRTWVLWPKFERILEQYVLINLATKTKYLVMMFVKGSRRELLSMVK